MISWFATSDAGDASMVEAARNGDREAFGQLYSRYSRMVHGILLARIPHTDVDDLVQEVFLSALPKLGALRDARRFGAWLAAIARNKAIDFHRRSRPSVELTDQNVVKRVDGQITGRSEHAEGLVILAAIRNLPDAYRETLLLRLVEGMTGPEIAAMTGLSHGSVRVNLHRGMQQLRKRLDQIRVTARPDLGSLISG